MKFQKYNHIENTNYKSLLNIIATRVDGSARYYVTEKIHGMNVQIALSNLDNIPRNFDNLKDYYPIILQIGTRNEWTTEPYIVNTITSSNIITRLAKLYFYLKDTGKQIDSIICYGELFGGIYPEVPKSKTAKRIQKGVYYSPDNHFLPFDIAIGNGDTKEYLCGDDFLSYCELFGIPTVPVLDTDLQLHDVKNYNEHFNSQVYKRYSLPRVEDNFAEGVVIKCYNREYALPNGDRVILKKKDIAFAEKAHKSEKKEVKELAPNLAEIYNKMLDYVTEARLVNVCSHHSQIVPKMIGQLIHEMTTDVLTDYSVEYSDFNSLEKADGKAITKELNKVISKLVVEYVANVR